MGQEIVYCATCQTRLRGSDFESGEAFRHQGQAFCPACAPEEARTRTPVPTATPSPREAPPRKSTRTMPLATATPKTTRHAKPPVRKDGKTPIVIGAAVCAVVVILIVAAASGGERPAPKKAEPAVAPPSPAVKRPKAAAVEPKPAPRRAPPPGRDLRESPDKIIRELEIQLASAQDPTAILMRCEQVRSIVKGTPQAERLKEIEAQAARMKASAGGKGKLEALLKEVRGILKSEHRFERKEEVRGMLRTALTIAGPRRAEIEKMSREFEESLREEAKREAASKPGTPVVEKIMLFDLDTGKAVPGFNPMKDGTVLDLAKLPARLEIRARVTGPGGKSVRFDLDGKAKHGVENSHPYELDGGKGGAKTWAAKAGKHTLTVTAYSKGSLKGVASKPKTVTFTVIRP